MRIYLYVAHTIVRDGLWSLEDLAGAAGRVDAAARVVQSALFLSHGIRDDTEAWIVVENERPVTIRFSNQNLRSLHPDERNISSRIRECLRQVPEDPWFEEIQPGVHAAPFGFKEALEEAITHTDGQMVILDKDGEDYRHADIPKNSTFVLSDHLPLGLVPAPKSAKQMQVSVGSKWYHGNHVVAALQIHLDGK